MGYYTGNGVVTTGVGNITAHVVHPLLICFRRESSAVVTKNGVALATAQAVQPSINNTSGDCTATGYRYPVPMRNGTIVRPRYSQIDGSNLYRLDTETVTYDSKINNGNWNQ